MIARRQAERGPRFLFVRAVLAVAAAYATVLLARLPAAGAFDRHALYPLAGFAALVLLLRMALGAFRYRGDPVLPAAALFLAGLGVVAQVRLGTLDFRALDRWANYALPAGVLAMLAVALALRRGRAGALAALHLPASLLASAILAGLLLTGQRFRGGVFLAGNVNPVEVVKVLLTVYLAGMFCVHRGAFERPVLPAVPALSFPLLASLAIGWVAPMVLVVLLRDLGLLALLNLVLLAMAVLSSGRWSYLLTGVLLAGGIGVLLLVAMPHGSGRLDAWLDPFADPTGRGWQVLQGLSAMCTGGLWGAGLGAGQPQAIPIAASDFVYAVLAEELGYAGCGLVLAVYVLFFYRGFRLADSLRDPFSQSLASGLTAALAVQALLNLGGVTKALPLTGIPLPFLSLGGSSLVTSFVMLGLLMAMSDSGSSDGTARKPARRTGRRPRGA